MTIWGNRVSPVFDSAQTVLLAEIKGTTVISRKREFIPVTISTTMARRLVELDIDTLICGAISKQPALIIEDAGIHLLPFITGNAEEILEAFVRDIPMQQYTMPGCSNTPSTERSASQKKNTGDISKRENR